ncbi:SulP family inorganic anion transporter [Curtobacterium sp. 314Chir4.1]|uniref:SulP family inorganic anion transporter n=1 Tax=Curtobacterium sp. 314Chir4.1 TaxID=1279028 RepID=UPI0020D1FE77|nr:SulP family inorganic anion transporter [Curtobacterium sp. 314Chir4.1]
MAYATIADLPVQVGLYTCIAPMVAYAVLGGSRSMSVSTTSTIATLTATTFVSANVASTSDEPTRALATLALLVGLVLLAARFLSLGSLVENINRSTLVGVQVGVGATVAVGQVPKLLGIDDAPSGRGFFRSLVATLEAIGDANVPTVVLSAISIGSLLVLRRVAPRVPGPLVVVAGGITASIVLDLPSVGVESIAAIPSGFPVPVVPDLTLVPALLPGAVGIATMAFLESAAVARGIRRPDEPQIDSDRELLATAVANIASAATQALPAAGGFSQSAVNQRSGARTQLSGLITAALAVSVALVLGPVLAAMPAATLAALVFTAVIGLIDLRALADLARVSRRDFCLAAVTAAVGLSAGLLPAVLVGVLGTFFLVLRELRRVRLTPGPRFGAVLTARIDGSVYTANVLEYERAVLALVSDDGSTDVVVLELPQMYVTSVTVLEGLADLDRELTTRGVTLFIAALPEEATATARRTEWFRGLAATGRVHPDLDSALTAARSSKLLPSHPGPSDAAQQSEPREESSS